VLTPEGPACGAIGQSVLDDQSDGGLNDTSGIVAARVSQVGHVGVEILAATGAIVLRVDHDGVAGPPGERIAEVVERTSGLGIAIGAVSAPGTGPSAVITALDADLGFGQILDAPDPLGRVGSIFAGSWHVRSPGRKGPTRKYARDWWLVHQIRPVSLL
jgi:hypothetical protein